MSADVCLSAGRSNSLSSSADANTYSTVEAHVTQSTKRLPARFCRSVWTHGTGGVDAGPLHGDGDAVEEDDDQHDVVKHLVGDDFVAQDPKPDKTYKQKRNLTR